MLRRREIVTATAGSVLLVSLTVVLIARPYAGGLPPKQKALAKVDVKWGVKIPMRDDVALNATLYTPSVTKKPIPAIVSISPYISDNYHDRAMYFAKHGYAFLMVDSRGRGNSGGKFEPFANEGNDGYDVVEWVAKQKWCDGKVGMWGGSYGGFNQWSTLKEFPPHLKTIVPVAAAHPGVDLPAPQGIADSWLMRWMTLTSGKTPNVKLNGDEEYWIPKFQKRFRQHIPFNQLDQVAGNPNEHFQKWLKHRTPDEYWDSMVPASADYSKIDIPILTITGHYDGDQLGAMEYYHRHMTHGSDQGKKNHYLIMGPWDHAGTRKPKEEMGGLKFGKASLIENNELHLAWYDWTLKGRMKPAQLSRSVMYYVGGLERWKNFDTLKDIPAEPHNFYLYSRGKANDVFQSGLLQDEKPGLVPPDKYVYDPLDLRPAELEQKEIKNFLTDQTDALNLFDNGLVYHSYPFPDSKELTGYVTFHTWIKLNVPDTDFQVILYEIQPDGTSILLTHSRLRARYRNSFRKAEPVKIGEITKYDFKSFLFTSRLIQKGSRLRLLIRSPNSIYMEKNYNSGGAVENESAKDAKTAEVTLYHDEDHPSYLQVPMVKFWID